jgi:hypothetical protein
MKVLEKAGEMSVYESAALPTELRRLISILNAGAVRVKKPHAVSRGGHEAVAVSVLNYAATLRYFS